MFLDSCRDDLKKKSTKFVEDKVTVMFQYECLPVVL